MTKPTLLRAPQLALAIALVAACGAPRPAPEPATPTSRPTDTGSAADSDSDSDSAADSAADSAGETEVLLACGRYRARLASGWRALSGLDAYEATPCFFDDLMQTPVPRTRGVTGGASRHVFVRGACRVELVVSELPEGEPPRDRLLELPSGARLNLRGASEGACGAELQPILEGSITPEAPAEPVLELCGDHTLEGPRAPGTTITMGYGVTDVWQLFYELRASSGAWSRIYCRYAVEPDAPGGFRPRLLPARPRWRAGPDPAAEWISDLGDDAPPPPDCDGARAVGPDPRVVVDVYVCGERAGRRALVRQLQRWRFAPPVSP